MLQHDGRVKVLDFGLAKLVERADDAAAMTATQTAAGMIMGSAAYMSPEQAEGKPLDGRSDIFSFGALLYELSTGTRAFRGDTQVSVLSEVMRHEPPLVTTLRPDLPSELARLIARCLRKDPARRVQSMADLKVALDDLREDSESGRLTAVAPALTTRGLPSVLVVDGAPPLRSSPSRSHSCGRARRRHRPPTRPAQPIPLTSYAGREASPTFSPDGTQVAFLWNGDREDNTDIYVKAIGGGPPLRLTTDPRMDTRPAWSPDGRYIAFSRMLDGEMFAVFVVPPLGGQERKIGEFHTRYVLSVPLVSLAWTTDSKFLFVSAALAPGGQSDIHRISLESGDVSTIQRTEPGANGFISLAVAPDGRTLAASLIHSSGTRSLLLISLSPAWEATGVRTLSAVGAPIESMAWTVDSRDLIYRIGVTLPVPLYRDLGQRRRANADGVGRAGRADASRCRARQSSGVCPDVSRHEHLAVCPREPRQFATADDPGGAVVVSRSVPAILAGRQAARLLLQSGRVDSDLDVQCRRLRRRAVDEHGSARDHRLAAVVSGRPEDRVRLERGRQLSDLRGERGRAAGRRR